MLTYAVSLWVLIAGAALAAPPENGDFESGDFAFWAPIQGAAWAVVDFDHPNRQGLFYASTCDRVWPGDGGCRDSAGEADTGVLASHVFTLSLPYIHFRLAGFNGPRCERDTNYLRLRLADTHAVLLQTKVPCQNPFEAHFWDVSPWLGERVYLAAEDGDDASGWAWIAVDDVRFEEGPPAPPGALEDFSVDPGAGRITFTSRRDGGEFLYGIGAEGGGLEALRYGDGKSFHPAWSADGRLAYVSGQRVRLFDGGPPRPLTHPVAAAHHPAWSPDGERLAYVAAPDGNDDLYELHLESGRVRRLTEAMGVSQPSWSADGRFIAFAAAGDIWRVEAATADLDRVVARADWVGFPAYAPVGRQLAYVADGELHVLEGDGQARQLTRGFAFVSDPAFSPAGRYIAFASERGGGQDIFLLELASGRVKQLTHDPADDFEPVFFAGDAFPVRPTAALAAEEPHAFRLAPNYPNPFNAETAIPYVLGRHGPVELAVYDLLGQKVRTLVKGVRPAGAQVAFWDGRDDKGRAVASGAYIYRLRTEEGMLGRRMMVLK